MLQKNIFLDSSLKSTKKYSLYHTPSVCNFNVQYSEQIQMFARFSLSHPAGKGNSSSSSDSTFMLYAHRSPSAVVLRSRFHSPNRNLLSQSFSAAITSVARTTRTTSARSSAGKACRLREDSTKTQDLRTHCGVYR